MAKVKDVISGCKAHDDITLLTIIKGYEVQFCGCVDTFMKCGKGDVMYEFANEIKNTEVKGKDLTLSGKLFIFI